MNPHTPKGLVLGSWTTRGLAAVTRAAAPAAPAKAAATAADPSEAPTAASKLWLAMGVLNAQGCAHFQKVCVYVRVLACVLSFGRLV